jgi:hypothetical protein
MFLIYVKFWRFKMKIKLAEGVGAEGRERGAVERGQQAQGRHLSAEAGGAGPRQERLPGIDFTKLHIGQKIFG